MRRSLAIAAVVVLSLAGCSPSPAPSSTADAAPVESASPEPSVARTPGATEVLVARLTEGLPASVAAEVMTASEPEPGRIEVLTTIVDPRGEPGSLAALDAIDICEAAVDMGATSVTVFESDGSTFVVYGHPSYGDVCAEV